MDATAKRTRRPPARKASAPRWSRTADETTTNLKPSSRYVAKDLFDGGRVPLLQSTLDHGHAGRGWLTVRGCAVTENVQQKRNEDQRVVHPVDRPLSAISGVAGAPGNPVKVAGMADLKFAERARFDGEEARIRTVKNKKYREGEVLVIRNERPQRGLGMREALATRDAVALLFRNFVCVARMRQRVGAMRRPMTSSAKPGIVAARQGHPACRLACRLAHAGYSSRPSFDVEACHACL